MLLLTPVSPHAGFRDQAPSNRQNKATAVPADRHADLYTNELGVSTKAARCVHSSTNAASGMVV